jgi:glycosyltransferase involved in cell wall biosynthesis
VTDKEWTEDSRAGIALSVVLRTDGERRYLAIAELPLVSIITPAYNRASYLDETIQSVLGQNYPFIEYIVLDDGSTDNTREVLEKYTGRIIWESHPNMGETRTVNKGWSMAKGEIVAVVNSDDPLLPGAVSTAVAFMQSHPDILVAYPDWDFIGPDSKVTGHIQVQEYDYLYMVRHHFCTPGPGAFIRHKAFELTEMRDPEFRYVADFEYWLRLGLYGKFARIPKTLATFRVHPDSASVSAKGKAMANEHIRLVRGIYSRPDLPPEVHRVRAEAFSWAHWVAGVTAGSNRWVALGHYFRAMLYHPPSFFRNLDKWQSALVMILPNPVFKVLLWGWHVVRSILARLRGLVGRSAAKSEA